ncbi:MAG: DUF5103 domain-containing protein [Paludibacter sp.]|nr:DUF5103 domain-containing protein [Paludibacter sp.]MDD4198646.1 DUF5103 domain-containing protein [Paludibacter sp.]MDD4428364.1 DUF5103 domain-containing protein [Paludibacter sp.]
MKYFFTLFLFLIVGLSFASAPYRTSIHAPNIKTLQIGVMGELYSLPVIELHESQKIEIRFDEMSHETRNYGYTFIHCNADWTPSDITSSEYLSGYTNGYVVDYNRSINTNYLYTNYKLTLPNDEMSFKISGNYVVLLYEDDQRNKPVAQACFSVVEPRVTIRPNIRYNTDIEINGRYQQLDFEVLLDGYYVRDPMSEIKAVVRQNNRTDNEVSNIKPNYITDSKLSYTNNKALIFEGGNEYHNFDISSVYAAGRGVDKIEYNKDGYNALLTPNIIQRGNYLHDFDVNGKFLINHQEAFEDIHTEADYIRVYFRLPVQRPFFDGQLYLGGGFNYNLLNHNVRMNYNNESEAYTQTVLLKQGGYDYQYWFVPKGAAKATAERVEGSYWQTKNEYTIYIYHRGWGERYDKLVGVIQF